MNRLQKKAQLKLAGSVASCIMLTPVFIIFSKQNVKGLDILIVALAGGFIAMFFVGLAEFRFYKKLDEREKDVYIKAMIFSMFVFFGFWFVFTFSAFLVIGGAGKIAVGILPMTLLGSFLVAQCSETAFLTVYFLREDDE